MVRFEDFKGEAYDVDGCEEKSTLCYSYYSCDARMEKLGGMRVGSRHGTAPHTEALRKGDQRHFCTGAGAGGDGDNPTLNLESARDLQVHATRIVRTLLACTINAHHTKDVLHITFSPDGYRSPFRGAG